MKILNFLAFASLLVGVDALSSEQVNSDVSEGPPGLVDPACISVLIEDGLEGYQGCLDATEWTPLVEKSKDGFGRDQYVVSSKKDLGEGWKVYTTTSELWKERVIEYVENTGGTGNFSRILGLPIEGDDYFWTAPGDRCNDGFQTVLVYGEETFTYIRAATPYRLLNYWDNTDWRRISMGVRFGLLDEESGGTLEAALRKLNLPRPFNDYAPYEDVDNSAASCFGYVIETQYVDQTPEYGLLVPKIYRDGLWSNDLTINECLSRMAERTISKYGVASFHDDYLYVSASDWQNALDVIDCPPGNMKTWLLSE